MHRRLLAIVCLVVLGLGLSGCSKCGWIWNEGARSCHSDATR
jgi:hypothetical protein